MKTDEKFKQFPCYGVFISYLLRFFHISTQRKVNNWENILFVQSKTQTIVLYIVNLSMYE